MTAVVLTPHPSDPSVTVAITAAPATIIVNRYDANGVNPVRLLEGQAPIAGDLTVTDYEAALTGSLRYDVVSSGATVATATTTLAGVEQPWLSIPVLPQNRLPLVAVLDLKSSREYAGTIHEIVQRADPIPTAGPLRLRKGTMRVWAPDYPSARSIEALCNLGEIVLLRQVDHDGLDLYLVTSDSSITHDEFTTEGWRWFVEFSYVETRSPTAPLMGSIGWNFDAMTEFGTFDQIQGAFTDFNDLVIGP